MGENLFYLSSCHGNTFNNFVNVNLFNHDIQNFSYNKKKGRGEWATLCYPSFIVNGDVMLPKRRIGDFEMVIPTILNVSSPTFTEIFQRAERRLQQILFLN
jgi:hypothetical protein